MQLPCPGRISVPLNKSKDLCADTGMQPLVMTSLSYCYVFRSTLVHLHSLGLLHFACLPHEPEHRPSLPLMLFICLALKSSRYQCFFFSFLSLSVCVCSRTDCSSWAFYSVADWLRCCSRYPLPHPVCSRLQVYAGKAEPFTHCRVEWELRDKEAFSMFSFMRNSMYD